MNILGGIIILIFVGILFASGGAASEDAYYIEGLKDPEDEKKEAEENEIHDTV